MKDIMLNRFSCRNFNNKKIDDEVVKDIIDLTRLTPSSLGLEPWKFMIISKSDDLQKLGEICNNQKQVSNCSHAVIVISRIDLQNKDPYLLDTIAAKGKSEEKIKMYHAMVSNRTGQMDEKELKHYADLQCYMATANLVNIAESKGVKSCIIGGFDYEKLAQFVDAKLSNTQKHLKPCIVIPLGYSDDKATPKIRHSLEDVLIWR
ncbi:nitroreductase family protein [Campylobacter blaseri]|uniref:NAD(P)H-dependent oxidoreductase n=1 Tax=Campylobacter blaseri TaxID=2042961 RepID=A0A2P8R0W6_9BACT|nr:nitroreductase family protein [Campylobacter blaseri]PSM52129.1 NAD(P)H-dependent oxidoreductase [Campylobacter blaseri]PSM53895.1 NAD(P)H-dependent oxidoreductase [Campylobacter blaseri]QKF85329.1 nitroreductase family protein [Campylobacter blaseri]